MEFVIHGASNDVLWCEERVCVDCRYRELRLSPRLSMML